MKILKYSKDLLEYIHTSSITSYNSPTTYELYTIYTTIPPLKLKDKWEVLELAYMGFIK
jgi:hypothetical protein